MEKIRAGILNSRPIRQLMKDSHFASQMTKKKLVALTAFVLIIETFFGKLQGK